MMSSAGIFVTLLSAAALLAVAEGWSYEWGSGDGPENWAYTYPDCGKDRQSPINIKDYKRTGHPIITWVGYDDKPANITLENSGYSVVLTGEGTTPKISFKHGEIFQLSNVHFHWGKVNWEGSEHAIFGRRFALEMHAVHLRVNEDGTPFSPQEIIVPTVLFEFTPRKGSPQNGLDNFIESVYQVLLAETKTSVKPFPWSDLIPTFTEDFYHYKGSLTTPPCSRVVTFLIRRQPSVVTYSQLEILREVLDSHNRQMAGNFRPLQKRGNRYIYLRE